MQVNVQLMLVQLTPAFYIVKFSSVYVTILANFHLQVNFHLPPHSHYKHVNHPENRSTEVYSMNRQLVVFMLLHL